MNKILLFMLILFIVSSSFVATFNRVSASGLIEDSWSTKAPMTQARYGLGVVAVDSKIYAIGGEGDRNSHTVTNINERYDPITNTWVTLEPMPTPRRDFAIAAYDGKLYCIGGGIHSSGPFLYDGLSVNEVYDIATDRWSTKASFPILQMNMQAHVVDEKIYVITSRGVLYMYDLIADKWTNKTSIPSPFDAVLSSAVVDGKIIVVHSIGTSVGIEPGVKIYDPKTDRWTEGSTPTYVGSFYWIERVGATTGVYAPQRLYVLGANELSNQVYDPVSDTWSNAKAMPTKRSQFGVATVDDVLYVIGGLNSSMDTCSINEQYVPIDYSAVPLSSDFSDPLVTSEPTPSKYLSTCIIVATLAITIGAVVTSLVCLFKARKKVDLKCVKVLRLRSLTCYE